jgi:hypothetical protein
MDSPTPATVALPDAVPRALTMRVTERSRWAARKLVAHTLTKMPAVHFHLPTVGRRLARVKFSGPGST